MDKGKKSLREYRWHLVINLRKKGMKQGEIAEVASLSQSAVSRILKRYEEQGEEGLIASCPPGAPRKMDKSLREKIVELLERGPQAHGFEGAVWTRKRVQQVIHENFNVNYREGQVGALLKERGYSLQKPGDRRQNPEAVRRWKEEQRPAIKKKALEEGRLIVYIDEAAFNLLCAVAKTWSLKGETPLLETGCRYQPLSVISAVTEEGDFYYSLQQQAFTAPDVVDFLRFLILQIDLPLLIIWDNASIHRAQAVKDFLRQENQGRIFLQAQPPYSPQLNADEPVWNWLKYHRLKNFCCKTLTELCSQINSLTRFLQSQPDLIRHFFSHPDLGFL